MNNQVFNFGCLVFGGQGRPNIDLVMWRGQIIILILREDFRNSINLGAPRPPLNPFVRTRLTRDIEKTKSL
jgi:hypothetical protein